MVSNTHFIMVSAQYVVVVYGQYFLVLFYGTLFQCSSHVPLSRGIPAGLPEFGCVFRQCSGVPCSVVPCSGVPGFIVSRGWWVGGRWDGDQQT